MARMKRPSYRAGVEWIALNDEQLADLDETRSLISVAMLADLFGRTTADVARDVLRCREREQTAQTYAW